MFTNRGIRFLKSISSCSLKPCNNDILTNSILLSNLGRRGISNGNEESNVRQMRLVKRIVAGLLFGSTLGLAIYSKRVKSSKLLESLEGSERLPKDHDYTSSIGSEFYRYKSYIFPSDIIKSGTLKQLDTLELNQNDIIVASFPKSGFILINKSI